MQRNILFNFGSSQLQAKCWSRLHSILVLYHHDNIPCNPNKNNINFFFTFTGYKYLYPRKYGNVECLWCIKIYIKLNFFWIYKSLYFHWQFDINSSMHWLTCNGYDHCFGSGYLSTTRGGGRYNKHQHSMPSYISSRMCTVHCMCINHIQTNCLKCI